MYDDDTTTTVRHYPTTHDRNEFKRIFHCELSKYWHPVFRFDILQFEDDLQLDAAGLSMAQVIRGRFGLEAEQLIRRLLGQIA